MNTRISDYNFDITDFDLFKRAQNHVPKELATIIHAIASTFFLSLNSLHFKVLSLPFLLNAQSLHQKRNVSLAQKNAQVIVKTALCVLVGLVANKAKALIVAPLGIYLISKKLHFEYSSSFRFPRQQSLTNSTSAEAKAPFATESPSLSPGDLSLDSLPIHSPDGKEAQGRSDSASSNPQDASIQSSLSSSQIPSEGEEELSGGSQHQQHALTEDKVKIFFGLDPSQRAESSIGDQDHLRPAIQEGVASKELHESGEMARKPHVPTLSLSRTNAVSVGRAQTTGIGKPIAHGGGQAQASKDAKSPQQSQKGKSQRKKKQQDPSASAVASKSQ